LDVKIDGKVYKVFEEKSIEEIIKENNIDDSEAIVAAKINNEIYDLNTVPEEDVEIESVKIKSEYGNRIYRRSLYLVLAKAVYELFPQSLLKIRISISNGVYCEIENNRSLRKKDVKNIKKKMKEIIAADLKINRLRLKKDEIIEIIKDGKCPLRAELIERQNKDFYTIYELDGYYDYFYYNMVPSTSFLNEFDIHLRIPGFVLLFPKFFSSKKVPPFKEQPKLANIFSEYSKLGEILGVNSVIDLNRIISNNEYNELIRIVEAFHEKKIAQIADQIKTGMPRNRIILIAGPTSSGKTTFTHRLSTQLKVNGLRPVQISTDNYFVSRDNTPLDEKGKPDFEALKAINLDLFNDHLLKLIQGESIELPRFDFEKGVREKSSKTLKLENDQPILIEGIHGLNDRLTEVIPQDLKFKIYVSALTQLNIDCHNRIPTTDTRLIRRIVRDNQFRGLSASQTLNLWESVRRGEEKNIFPYQENANTMFNSALIYELSVLKNYVEPLLKKIDKTEKNYYQAQRLIEMLSNFKAMPDVEVPHTSILREFTGRSIFREQ
jgi:uridine kinase